MAGSRAAGGGERRRRRVGGGGWGCGRGNRRCWSPSASWRAGARQTRSLKHHSCHRRCCSGLSRVAGCQCDSERLPGFMHTVASAQLTHAQLWRGAARLQHCRTCAHSMAAAKLRSIAARHALAALNRAPRQQQDGRRYLCSKRNSCIPVAR